MSRLRKAAEATFLVCGSTCGSLRKHARKAAEACTYNSPIPPKGFRLRVRRVVSLKLNPERRGA